MRDFGGIGLDNMQEEAMRRVREMQSGRGVSSSHHSHKTPQEKTESKALHHEESTPQKVKISSEEISDFSPLGGLFRDKEKLLILLLVMLLSQEGTNTELVLALLYIIV